MTIDIKDLYLNTLMERYEYMRIKLSNLPNNVIKQYNLERKVTADGWVYVEVRKGMYGLPQAGILAQDLSEERPKKTRATHQSALAPGFWSHKWHPISFTLCVNDFSGQVHAKQDQTSHNHRTRTRSQAHVSGWAQPHPPDS